MPREMPRVYLWKHVETCGNSRKMLQHDNAPTFATTRCHQWRRRRLCRHQLWCQWCRWQYAVGEGGARQRHRYASVPHPRPWDVQNTSGSHMKSVESKGWHHQGDWHIEEQIVFRSMILCRLCIQTPLCKVVLSENQTLLSPVKAEASIEKFFPSLWNSTVAAAPNSNSLVLISKAFSWHLAPWSVRDTQQHLTVTTHKDN